MPSINLDELLSPEELRGGGGGSINLDEILGNDPEFAMEEAKRAGYTPSWEEDTGMLRGHRLPSTAKGKLDALTGALRTGYQTAMGAWPAYVLDPIAAAAREGRLPQTKDIGSGAFMSNVQEDIANTFGDRGPTTLGQARFAAGLENAVQLATDPLNPLEITNPFALTAMGLEGAVTAQEQAEIPSEARTPEEALMEQARLEQAGGMAVLGAGAGATTGMSRAHAQVGKWNKQRVERLAAEQAARLARARELAVPEPAGIPDYQDLTTPYVSPGEAAWRAAREQAKIKGPEGNTLGTAIGDAIMERQLSGETPQQAAQRAATEAFMQRRATPDFEQELLPPPMQGPPLPPQFGPERAIADMLMEQRLGRKPEPPPPPPVQDVDFIAPEMQGPPRPLAPSGELEQALPSRVSRLRGIRAPKKWSRANIMGTLGKMLEPSPEDVHAALKARVAELADKGAQDSAHYFADEDAYRAAYEMARDEALKKGTTVEALYPELAKFEDQAGLQFGDSTVTEDLSSRLTQRRATPILAGTEFEGIGRKRTKKQERLGTGHLTIQELRKAVRYKSGPLYRRALRAMKEKMLADAAEQWEARVSEEERMAPPPDADVVRDSIEPEGPVDASFDPSMLEEGAPRMPKKLIPPGEGPSGPVTMREGAIMNLSEAHNDMRIAERLYKAGKLSPMSYFHAALRNVVNDVTSMLPEGLRWDKEAADRFQRTRPRLTRPIDAQGATSGHRIGSPEVSFNPEHAAWTYVLRTLQKGEVPTPAGFVDHMFGTVGHELGHASSAASHEFIMAPPDTPRARSLGVGEEHRFRTSADIATRAVRESPFAQGMLATANQPGSTLYGAIQKLLDEQMPEATQAIADVKAGRKVFKEGGGLLEVAAGDAAALENALVKAPTEQMAAELGIGRLPAPDIGQQGMPGVETPQQRLALREAAGMAQEGAPKPLPQWYNNFLQDAAKGTPINDLRAKYNAPLGVKTFQQLKDHLLRSAQGEAANRAWEAKNKPPAASSAPITKPAAPSVEAAPQKKVTHPKYGEGVVRGAVEGGRVKVHFPSVNLTKVVPEGELTPVQPKPKVQFKKKEEYPAPPPPGQRNLFSSRIDPERVAPPPKPTQGALFAESELRTGLTPEELAKLPDKRQKALFEEETSTPTKPSSFDLDLTDPATLTKLYEAKSLVRIQAGEHLNEVLVRAGKAPIEVLRTTQQNQVASTIVKDLEAGKLPKTYEAVLEAAEKGMGRVGGRATAVAKAIAERYALEPKKLSKEQGAVTLQALTDFGNWLARGAGNLAETALVATAAGLDTAVNNLANGLVHQGVNAISDFLMAAVGGKEAGERLAGYGKAAKDTARFGVAGVGRFTNIRRSRVKWLDRALRDTEDARAVTAIGLDPKLYHRIWNHTVAMGPTAGVGVKERFHQYLLAPNILSDHATFMTVFAREMKPAMDRLGVRTMGDLRRALLQNPTLLDGIRDDILFSATEGARAAFKLGPAGYSPGSIPYAKAFEKISNILSNYPALQLVTMKFSNYILNNMFPYMLDSFPLVAPTKVASRRQYAPIASSRAKLSMDYPVIKREYESAMLAQQRMKAQLQQLVVAKRRDPSLQPQYTALKRQLANHIKSTEGLRADYRRAQRVGVYRRTHAARQEGAGLMALSIFALYGMMTPNPEEAWDKVTVGEGKDEKLKKSIVPALGALAPYAYAGYRIAQHVRGVPETQLKNSRVNFRDDIEQMFGSRTAEWPTILTALFGEDRYLDELYRELDKSGFSQGKIATQPWPFDILRFLGKLDYKNKLEYSPKTDTPRDAGVGAIAGRFAKDMALSATARMPFAKQVLPPQYDPTSGKQERDEGGFFLRTRAFSPLREFIDNNKNLISYKEIWFPQTGAREWDDTAFAYIRNGVEKRVNPIISSSRPVDVKAAEIKREMGRIQEEARRLASRRAKPGGLPSSEVRKLEVEKRNEEMSRKSRILGKDYKSRVAPLTPTEKRRMLESDRIASPPS